MGQLIGVSAVFFSVTVLTATNFIKSIPYTVALKLMIIFVICFL